MPRIDPSLVRLVDAFKIRQTLDPDFSALHCHSTAIHKYYTPKYYIPQGEWWLDVRLKDEMDFFLKSEAIVHPKTIKTSADFHEYLKAKLCKKGPIPNFRVKTHWRLGSRIVLVDGKVVRQYLDPEFTQGGHEKVYRYVPKGEIWIECALHPKEIPFAIHHETIERKMMFKGKSYDIAHEYATAAEKEMRRAYGGFYPLDDHYPWSKLTDDQIREKYYVRRSPKK
ncbi:hypothetical protein HZA85_01460 [Candidatus Uhrbacteria bacterium]|nr:hypothetical protein [Candidatus Uhrbacteria bacterium]